jgi:hypothetical protein
LFYGSPASADGCKGPALREAIAALPADDKSLAELAKRCAGEMVARAPTFFRGLDDDQVALIWVAQAAHLYRPYGHSMAFTLEDLVRERQLDCDNYVFLTVRLFRLLRPASSLDVDIVGWERGMIGNHAQIIVNHPTPLLVDPTVGVVARGGFDEIARGMPVSSSDIVILSERDNPPGFRDRVIKSLETGAYRPSHLLYYFNDPDDYPPSLSNVDNWPTPAIQERAR